MSKAFEREFDFVKISISAHKNLINVHEICEDTGILESPRFCIIMQPMETDLLSFMTENFQSIDMIQKIVTMKQMLEDINHVHNNGFIHHDIKLSNFLISTKANGGCTPYSGDSKYIVQLTDFGHSTRTRDVGSQTRAQGTLGYRAPEQLMKRYPYSTPIDIWAFGACMLLMCTYTQPPKPESVKENGEKKYEHSINSILRVLGTPSRDNGFDASWPAEGQDEENEIVSILKALGHPSQDPDYKHGYYHQTAQFIGNNSLDIPDGHYQYYQIGDYIDDQELRKVIRGCLQWNPRKRTTAQRLSQMPYFQGSHIRLDKIRDGAN